MPPDQLSKQIQDALVTNEKVREGLASNDALPFMDWGSAYADVLAQRLAAPEAPEPGEEQVNETAYVLARLMTRMNWLVTYRNQKDAAWLTQTFQMVNKLSRDLLGEAAPVFAEEEITVWLAEHSTHTDSDLLKNLMARLSPPALTAPAVEPPPETPTGESAPLLLAAPEVVEPPPETPPAEGAPPAPEAPASPLSNWVFGMKLPGRSKPSTTSDKPDLPLQPGEDKHD